MPAVPTATLSGLARACAARSDSVRSGLSGATKKPPGSSTTLPR